MIDTIKIYVQNGEFTFNKEKMIWNILIDQSKNTGYEIRKEKYYLNNDIINVDITGRGLSVHTNISRLLGFPHNYTKYSFNDFISAIENLRNELKKNEIIVNNFYESELIRVDIYKDIILENSIIYYWDVFKHLRTIHSENRIDFISGYRISNKSRQIVFYDKVKELAEKYNTEIAEKNIMRVEIRFLNKRAIKRYLKISTIKELMSIDYDKIFKSIIEKTFNLNFNGGGKEMDNKKNKVEHIDNFIQVANDMGIDYAIRFFGIYTLYSIPEYFFKEILQNESKYKRYKTIKKIRELKNKFGSYYYSFKDKDFIDKYNEIKNKLLA